MGILNEKSEFYKRKSWEDWKLLTRNTILFSIITVTVFFFSLISGIVLSLISFYLIYIIINGVKKDMEKIKKLYYPTGQLKRDSKLVFKCHGHTTIYHDKTFYENGQLKSESHTNNYSKEWYENGQLKSEEDYKDDIVISKKCWDENGNEIKCK